MKKTMYFLLMVFLISGCGSPAEQKPQKQPVPSKTSKNIIKEKTDYYEEGIKQLKKGNLQEAVTSLEKQVKENPNDIRTYSMLGSIYMKAKKLSDAKAVLEMGIKIDPQNAEIYFSLAQCYDRLGDKQSAIEAIKKSVSIYKVNNDEANFKKSAAAYQMLTNQISKENKRQPNP